MNNTSTVSDTKKAFYSIHTRPINSIYSRVVEELIVEMHLISVNVDFSYDPFYGLGVVTAFDSFMEGYSPEADKESIFQALLKALGEEAEKYRSDGKRLEDLAKGMSASEVVLWLSLSAQNYNAGDLQDSLKAIANNPKFKYSRLFAIGLFSFLELAAPELVKDEARRVEALKKVSQALNLPEEKLLKDLELYRDNLDKITQAKRVMEDTLQAARKKREERAQEKGAIATPPQ